MTLDKYTEYQHNHYTGLLRYILAQGKQTANFLIGSEHCCLHLFAMRLIYGVDPRTARTLKHAYCPLD